MYIQEIVIDGFKSYATRTVISGFDPRFNAITGLNGSGKSNILDAICFVLGISNLSQVRANNLQELVYKHGQAGVTKASVSIVFNNSDAEQSPVGWEQHEIITVTRQIAIGGKSKYIVNGRTVTAEDVKKLFHSVSLNVNNPHFLIMQGRITKVLNMKPPEILGLIEEAAGTRMFEDNKTKVLKTMAKKQSKVEEINRVLADEITPTIERLREEYSDYLAFEAQSRECRDLEERIVAREYRERQEEWARLQQEVAANRDRLQALREEAAEQEAATKRLAEEMEELQEQREQSLSREFHEAKEQEQRLSVELVKATEAYEHKRRAVEEEEQRAAQLQQQLEEAHATLARMEDVLAAARRAEEEAQAEAHRAAEAVAHRQRALHAARSGLAVQEDGATNSLQGQVMSLQRAAKEAESEASASEMRAEHLRGVATDAEAALGQAEAEYRDIQRALDQAKRQEGAAREQLQGIDFNPEQESRLSAQVDRLQGTARTMKARLDAMLGGIQAPIEFDYDARRMGRGWDPSRVKGVVARLIRVQDSEAALALELVAGGKLWQVVVDSKDTAKALLERKGVVTRRTTFIPLDAIQGARITDEDRRRIERATRGRGVPAVDLIQCAPELEAAVQYVFGKYVVCRDRETQAALKGYPSVTLDGEVFDGRVMEGGSAPQGAGVLEALRQVGELQDQLDEVEAELRGAQEQLDAMRATSEAHSRQQAELEMAQHAVRLAEDRLNRSTYAQTRQRAEQAREDADGESQRAEKARSHAKDLQRQAERLEADLAAGEQGHHRIVQEAENALQAAKEAQAAAAQRARDATAHADTNERERESAETELEQLRAAIDASEQALADLRTQADKCYRALEKHTEKYEKAAAVLNEHKAAISLTDSNLARLEEAGREAKRRAQEAVAEAKSVEHGARHTEKRMKEHEKWLKSYEWVEERLDEFLSGGMEDPWEGRSLAQMREEFEKLHRRVEGLSRKVNRKAQGMMDRAEKEYQELRQKQETIEHDRRTLQATIDTLDEKKNETLRKTWTKVNRDFGSIFSTLLPGTSAKLEPPEGGSVLDGLEVRVAFNGVWKDSLSELSGGQRSLLALSLILSLLLFKPAPMYILDEVDAALDLSHTQNIGHMLRTHFARSQFLVVSLKQGMFSNANVIFRTKFVDGVSTVTRTVPSRAARLALEEGDDAGQAATGGGRRGLEERDAANRLEQRRGGAKRSRRAAIEEGEEEEEEEGEEYREEGEENEA